MFAMQPRVVSTFKSKDHQSLAVVTTSLGEKWVVIGIYLHRFPVMTVESSVRSFAKEKTVWKALGSILAGALGGMAYLTRHRRR